MQKIATKVFIFSSLIFGAVGIALILSLPGAGEPDTATNMVLIRLLFADAFIILPSFALSIAGKYLKTK
jgi:hypothetical protein